MSDSDKENLDTKIKSLKAVFADLKNIGKLTKDHIGEHAEKNKSANTTERMIALLIALAQNLLEETRCANSQITTALEIYKHAEFYAFDIVGFSEFWDDYFDKDLSLISCFYEQANAGFSNFVGYKNSGERLVWQKSDDELSIPDNAKKIRTLIGFNNAREELEDDILDLSIQTQLMTDNIERTGSGFSESMKPKCEKGPEDSLKALNRDVVLNIV